MLIRLLFVLWLSGFGLPAAQSQQAPRPESLARAWIASQAALGENIARVEVRERSLWTLDGPTGVRRMHLVADVAGGPNTDGWERTPIAAEINGRRVPLERWRELDHRRRALMGRDMEQAVRSVTQIHHLLGRLEPAGDTQRETLDGIRCWRIELVPRNRREALERYTLWFDQDRGHLLRSRAVVRGRRSETPVLIITDYSRESGLDVPRHRTMEGSLETRRRLHRYTLLFKYEASYTDYRLIRRH